MKILPYLSTGELVEERPSPRPRPEETVDLEGHDGSRVEPQGSGVLRKVGQEVMGVEEADHSHPGGDIHRVHVVPVDEGTEAVDRVRRGGIRLLLVAPSPLLGWREDEARRIAAHAGHGLPQVVPQDGSLRLRQARAFVRLARHADPVRVQIHEPDVVRELEVPLVLEERAGYADDVGRGGEEELLRAAHAGGKERDDGEHVLQGIEHRDEGQDRHGQGVVVAGLKDHLVLQHDEGEDLETSVHPKELQRQMKREIHQMEPGVVRQGKDERSGPEGSGKDFQLDPCLARDGHGGT